MEQRVLPQPEVVALLKKFVTVQLYTDFVPINSITPDAREETRRRTIKERLIAGRKSTEVPSYAVLSPTGDMLGRLDGYHEPPEFVDFLSKALESTSDGSKMASVKLRMHGDAWPSRCHSPSGSALRTIQAESHPRRSQRPEPSFRRTFSTSAGSFTGFIGGSPRRMPTTSVAIVTAIVRSPSSVWAALWGVTITSSRPISGWPGGGGSTVKTSAP